MRFIGDVHGKFDQYLQLIEGVESSVQVGDMGFDYSKLHDNRHMFIAGNHDHHSDLIRGKCNNWLGRYGLCKDLNFFFVGGATSIDKQRRRPGLDWFDTEELSFKESLDCIDLYEKHKGQFEIVVSHDCPQFVAESMFGIYDRSHTRRVLEIMFTSYEPKIWIFGHHHKSMDVEFRGCRFICLDELEVLDL